jgi:hypothetical protein
VLASPETRRHPGPGLTLPAFTTPIDACLPDIMTAASDLVGRPVVPLRMDPVEVNDAHEATSLLVETEPLAGHPRTPYGWAELDRAACDRLLPPEVRARLADFVQERDEGWSPLRPQWSRPGWFRRASAWMEQQLAEVGLPVNGAPQLHQLGELSVVLRATTGGADAFMKASVHAFRHEAVLTQALARHMPEVVPEVLAVEPAYGWLLMRDMGAQELGHQDASRWGAGLESLAAVQQSWLGQATELARLGVPVRSLPALAAEVHAWAEDDDAMAELGPEHRDQWTASAPALVEACRRLHEIGPGPTLVHGDFHPWNVVLGSAGVRIFDWTDAAISHPFVDLATYLPRTTDLSVRRHLLETYLEAWKDQLPADLLQEAGRLAIVVGSLYQVQTYRLLQPTLQGGMFDGSDVRWMKRSIERLRHGLDPQA